MPLAPSIADCSPKYTGVSSLARASRCRSESRIGGAQSRSSEVHCAFAPLWKRLSSRSSSTSGYCQFALAAARQALAAADLVPAELEPGQVGAIVSSGVGGLDEIERNHRALLERGVGRMSPFALPMMLTDSAAGLVAIHTGAVGPNYGVVSACASSAHGIGEAAAVIARGEATAMLAGGGGA